MMKFTMTENGFETVTGFGSLQISAEDTYGFRPYQLMISSLVGCSGSVMKKIFNKKRLQVDDIQIEADVVRNPDKADRIEKVHLLFKIKGEHLEGKMDRVMELTKKHCSMVQSVEGSIEVTETYQLM